MNILRLKQFLLSRASPTHWKDSKDYVQLTAQLMDVEMRSALPPQSSEGLTLSAELMDVEMRAAVPNQDTVTLNLTAQLTDVNFQTHPHWEAYESVTVTAQLLDVDVHTHPNFEQGESVQLTAQLLEAEVTSYSGGDSSHEVDPYWDNVVALLHLEGTAGSKVYTDETGVTGWWSTGGTALTETYTRFGVSGLNLPYSGRLQSVSDARYVLGTGDFTAELWLSPEAGGSGDSWGRIMQWGPNNTAGSLRLARISTSQPWALNLQGHTGSTYIDVTAPTTDTLTPGVFNHVAVTRASGTWRLFINGKKVSENYYVGTGSDLTANYVMFGANTSDGERVNGVMDEIRITKGVARYTTDFDVPAQPFGNKRSRFGTYMDYAAYANGVAVDIQNDLPSLPSGSALTNHLGTETHSMVRMVVGSATLSTADLAHLYGSPASSLQRTTSDSYIYGYLAHCVGTLSAWPDGSPNVVLIERLYGTFDSFPGATKNTTTSNSYASPFTGYQTYRVIYWDYALGVAREYHALTNSYRDYNGEGDETGEWFVTGAVSLVTDSGGDYTTGGGVTTRHRIPRNALHPSSKVRVTLHSNTNQPVTEFDAAYVGLAANDTVSDLSFTSVPKALTLADNDGLIAANSLYKPLEAALSVPVRKDLVVSLYGLQGQLRSTGSAPVGYASKYKVGNSSNALSDSGYANSQYACYGITKVECFIPAPLTHAKFDTSLSSSKYSYGNYKRSVISMTNAVHAIAKTQQGHLTGKRVFMISLVSQSQNDGLIAGIVTAGTPTGNGTYPGATSSTYGCQFNRDAGTVTVTNATYSGNIGTRCEVGDVAMVAVDFDSGKIWYGRSGVWYSGDPTTGTSPSQTFTPGQVYYAALSQYYLARVNAFFDPALMPYEVPVGFTGWGESEQTQFNVKLPLTFDENDTTQALTWTRQGSVLPTPEGAEFDGYQTRLMTTSELPFWVTSSASPLTIHATVRANPSANTSKYRILSVGGTDSNAYPKLALSASLQGGANTRKNVISLESYTSSLQTYPLNRQQWCYEFRTPDATIDGEVAKPYGMYFITDTQMLLCVTGSGVTPTAKPRVYLIDTTTGETLDWFQFPDGYGYTTGIHKRSDGTWWLTSYTLERLVCIDLSASFATQNAVIVYSYNLAAMERCVDLEWATIDGTEYLLIAEYTDKGAPYLYVIDPSILSDGGTWSGSQYVKRFIIPTFCNGFTYRNGKVYITSRPDNISGDTATGVIRQFPLDLSAANGTVLVSDVTNLAPSIINGGVTFHPTTGRMWASSNGYTSDSDIAGWMSVWSTSWSNVTSVESSETNHYTLHYTGSGQIIVKLNNRPFTTLAWTPTITPTGIVLGGFPTAAAGWTTGYFSGVVRNVVIQNYALTNEDYTTAVNGLDSRQLQVYDIPIADSDANNNSTAAWTNEVGTVSVFGSKVEGTNVFYGGTVASSRARQRLALNVSALDIDNGLMYGRLRWLQGNNNDTDYATAGMRFLASASEQLQESIAPATRITPDLGLRPRTFAAPVPSLTRMADVVMQMTRLSGVDNNGYVQKPTLTLYNQGTGLIPPDGPWGETLSLMTFNGLEGGVPGADVTGNGSWTPSNAVLTTTGPAPGMSASLLCNGTNTQLLSSDGFVPFYDHDFMIEAVIYINSISTCFTILDRREPGNNNGVLFGVYSGGNLSMEVRPSNDTGSVGGTGSNAGAVPLNQWTYVAVQRTGDTYRWFVGPPDGTATLVSTSTTAVFDFNSWSMKIGATVDNNSSWAANGKIAAVRATIGANHTASFPVPTLPWTTTNDPIVTEPYYLESVPLHSPVTALSLDKLSKHAFKCLRIRRGNDGVECDIGFRGNALDRLGLMQFLGGNNGYVARVYDQSGNGKDLVFSDASRQPRLTDGSTYLGYVSFNGSSDRGVISGLTFGTPYLDIYTYMRPDLTTDSGITLELSSNSNNFSYTTTLFYNASIGGFTVRSNNATTQWKTHGYPDVVATVFSQISVQMHRNLTGLNENRLWINGEECAATPASGENVEQTGNFANDDIWVGGRGATTDRFAALKLRTLVLYRTDTSFVRERIETVLNQAGAVGLYPLTENYRGALNTRLSPVGAPTFTDNGVTFTPGNYVQYVSPTVDQLENVDYTFAATLYRRDVSTAVNEGLVHNYDSNQANQRSMLNISGGKLNHTEQTANGASEVATSGIDVVPIKRPVEVLSTRRGNYMEVYQDGVLRDSLQSTALTNYSRTLRLGTIESSGSYQFPFLGSLSNVGYWTRSVTPSLAKLTTATRPYDAHRITLLPLSTDYQDAKRTWSSSGALSITGGKLVFGARDGSRLRSVSDLQFHFSHDDFCIELYVKPDTGASDDQTLFSKTNGGSDYGYWFGLSSTNQVLFRFNTPSGLVTFTGGSVDTTNELHVAVYRLAKKLYIAVNGAVSYYGAANMLYQSDAMQCIGAMENGTLSYKGSIRGLRVTRGSSGGYGLSPFIPPKLPFATVPSAEPVNDQYYHYVVALFNGDGENSDTGFTDLRGRYWAREGAAVLSDTKAVFKDRVSIALPQSSRDDGYATDAGLIVTGESFTMEGWVYLTDYGYNGNAALFSQAVHLGNGDQFFGLINGKVTFYRGSAVTGGAKVLQGLTTHPLNTWIHIEAGYDGEFLYVFANGKLEAVGKDAYGWVNTGQLFRLGREFVAGYESYRFGLPGYIGSFRVTKGMCRHTETFPLETRPLYTDVDPLWENVKSLLLPLGGGGDNALIDRKRKEAWNKSGTTAIVNGQLSLTGSGYYWLADSDDWALSGDFCIELFDVTASSSDTMVLLSHYDFTGNQRGWDVEFDSGRVVFEATTDGTSGTFVTLQSTTIPNLVGTSHDVCVERKGTTLRLYVDGVMVGKTTTAFVSFNSNTKLMIGGANALSGTQYRFNGTIGCVRLTNAARYDSDAGYFAQPLPVPVVGEHVTPEVPSYLGSDILTKLTSWWDLDEVSGTRNDSHGTNHLSVSGTVASAPGLRGTDIAAVFDAGTLYRASNATLNVPSGGGDHCLFGWFKPTALSGYQAVVSKWDATSSGSLEYAVQLNNSENNGSNGGSTYHNAYSDVSLSNGQWYFAVLWRDSTDGLVRYQINNGNIAIGAYGASDPPVTSIMLCFGKYNDQYFQFKGQQQNWGWMKGAILTAEERAWLYNDGLGRTYEELISEPVVGSGFNPADKNAGISLSDGNTTATSVVGGWKMVRGTEAKTTGKWYAEFKVVTGVTEIGGSGAGDVFVGTDDGTSSLNTYPGSSSGGRGYYCRGNYYGTSSGGSGGPNWGTDRVIGIAYDADAGKIWFSRDGIWNGNPVTGDGPYMSSVPTGQKLAFGPNTVGAVVKLRTSSADLQYPIPDGYNVWGGGITEPKLAFEYAYPEGPYAATPTYADVMSLEITTTVGTHLLINVEIGGSGSGNLFIDTIVDGISVGIVKSSFASGGFAYSVPVQLIAAVTAGLHNVTVKVRNDANDGHIAETWSATTLTVREF